MSTRSVIAQRAGDGWEGVYHHSDGYPTGLGCYLFRLIRHQYKGDVHTFLNWVLSHDGGWSSIYSGPEGPTCYCHGYFAERDRIEPGQKAGWHTSEEHGFDIEWVYAFDPNSHKMAVLKHDLFACSDYKSLPSARTTDKATGPCMKLAGVVDLNGPEPDWGAIECGPDLERCLHVEGYTHEDRGTWVDRYLPPIPHGVG